MIKITANSPIGAEFLAGFLKIHREMEETRREWVARMRENPRVALIQPDDGWVDRDNNSVSASDYADFVRIKISVGDLIVLGCPDKYRIVEIISIRKNLLGDFDIYYFKEI